MRRREIGRGKRAAQAVAGDHLVHPGEALEMVLIELTRLRRALCREDAGRVSGEDGAVRYVREARNRQRSRPHAVREIVVGARLRGDPARPAKAMDIDGYGIAQHVECRGSGLGRLSGGGRAARFHTTAQHHADRRYHRAPDPPSTRQRMAVTATIHAVLPGCAGVMATAL